MEDPTKPEFLRYHELIAVEELEKFQASSDEANIEDSNELSSIELASFELSSNEEDDDNIVYLKQGEGYSSEEEPSEPIEPIVDNHCHCSICVAIAEKRYEAYQNYEMLLNELNPNDEQFYTKKEKLLYALVCALKTIDSMGECLGVEEQDFNVVWELNE